MKTTPTNLVAIADDHKMVRKGIVDFINSYNDFKVVIESDNGEDLINAIKTSDKQPDIAVIDIKMPIMNGYETVLELKKNWPDIRILVLTMINNEFSTIRMLRNGAMGYVLKDAPPEELHKGLQEVANNNFFNSNIVSNNVFSAISQKRNGQLFPDLSELELLVLANYCKGLDNKDIAKTIGVSTRTIDTHRNALFSKLNVQNRVELVVFAMRTGLVSLD